MPVWTTKKIVFTIIVDVTNLGIMKMPRQLTNMSTFANTGESHRHKVIAYPKEA